MVTYSSGLAWRIGWTECPAGYSSWGRKESHMTERLTLPEGVASARGLLDHH